MNSTSTNAKIFQSIPSRPAPNQSRGLVGWAKANLFASPLTSLGTLLIGAIFLLLLPKFFSWALLNAVWIPNAETCKATSGACWGVVTEKLRFIIFGRYPFEEQWRPLVASIALIALVVASCMRVFWKTWLIALWAAVLALFFGLMSGGFAGLSKVTTDIWGGLPLTLMLATLSMTMAFPIALLVAMGRRSSLPAIRSMCTVYVELIRGVPLISVLFMASFMFPLLMPAGLEIDVLVRVLAGITFFAAAYMAEVIRGGLQALPKGQVEAAASLGLSYWQTQQKIVLPQALAMVVPGIMNNFISTFKDTSLVTIVSLYELSGAMGLALNSDSDWRPFKIEAYFFITLIYFIFCFSMSRYSKWIETQVNKSKLR